MDKKETRCNVKHPDYDLESDVRCTAVSLLGRCCNDIDLAERLEALIHDQLYSEAARIFVWSTGALKDSQIAELLGAILLEKLGGVQN